MRTVAGRSFDESSATYMRAMRRPAERYEPSENSQILSHPTHSRMESE